MEQLSGIKCYNYCNINKCFSELSSDELLCWILKCYSTFCKVAMAACWHPCVLLPDEEKHSKSCTRCLVIRLRVVPLSLSPSCVTWKKFARKKWRHEILGARSARKEGLLPKPKSLPFHGRMIFWCRISHLDVLLLSPVINSPGRSE